MKNNSSQQFKLTTFWGCIIFGEVSFIIGGVATYRTLVGDDFLGLMGAIIGGLITLFVLDKTIKNGDAHLEKNINSGKRLDLCKDVANTVAQYCTVARKKRNLYSNKYKIDEKLGCIERELCSVDRIIAELLDDETNVKYENLEKEKESIKVDLERELSEIDNTDTTTPTFLLEIKLTGIKEADELIERVRVINRLIESNVISNNSFENHISKLLEETTKFINEYPLIKK